MTVFELIERLSKEDEDAEVCIMRAHDVGGISHHEILGPNRFFGHNLLCLSIGESMHDDAVESAQVPGETL